MTFQIVSMAFNRETYKDKVEEKLQGAIGEFYKYKLARKNGFTKWTDHWSREVDRLINIEFREVLQHRISGFKDRRKATFEIVLYMVAKENQYRRIATNTILRDFKIKKVKKQLDEKDAADFYIRVHDIINDVISGIIK